MTTCCVVVIGHVDHGKTALVGAITGIETDRLAEEKARGLSITPGFAHRTYAEGTIDFVDAPGHEDFIQGMISGASGASAALVVISSVEGIRAQTLEHLRIAGLLGITRALVVLTKSELLPPSEHAARLAKIKAALADTAMYDAPFVLCSARTGAGLEQVNAALAGLLTQAAERSAPLDPYLAIDRVFSLPGQGTIVTGTLLGGDLAVGDVVTLYPADRPVTLRELHCRGQDRARVEAGERVAANLRNVAASDVARGDVLGRGFAPTTCMDVRLDVLHAERIKHMQEVRVHFGTSNMVAQVRLFRDAQDASQNGHYAQLRFRTPVCGYAGQRAVLRRLSPAGTIAGAVLLDPQATTARRGDADRLRILAACDSGEAKQIALALATAHGGTARLGDVSRLSRMPPVAARAALGEAFENLDHDELADKQMITAAKAQLLQALAEDHAANPLHMMTPRTRLPPQRIAPILQRHIETTLLADGQIRRDASGLALADHDPITRLTPDQRSRMADIEQMFRDAGLTPLPHAPLVQDPLDRDLFDLLIATQRLLVLPNISLKQEITFHTDALVQAAETLLLAFPPPRLFTTSAARSALSTSRKVIVPVLEHFDQTGVTRRHGDMREMVVSPPETDR